MTHQPNAPEVPRVIKDELVAKRIQDFLARKALETPVNIEALEN